MATEKQIEANKNNAKKGGRKPGTKNTETLVKEKVEAALRQRIFQIADSLLNAQQSIAKGQQFLYKIKTYHKRGPKGGDTITRSEPILITDPWEIELYLNEKLGNTAKDPDVFYFITTRAPDNRAIDSLLNRALGKPKEAVEITNPDGNLKTIIINKDAGRDKSTS